MFYLKRSVVLKGPWPFPPQHIRFLSIFTSHFMLEVYKILL